MRFFFSPNIRTGYITTRGIMTIENETSKKVSDRELLDDIYNTEKELKAYKNLWMGYQALAELPENQGAKSSEYRFQCKKFQGIADRCEDFLKQIKALRDERGI